MNYGNGISENQVIAMDSVSKPGMMDNTEFYRAQSGSCAIHFKVEGQDEK